MTDEEKIKSEESEAPPLRRADVSHKPEDIVVEEEKKEENRNFFGRKKCKDCEKLELECAEYKTGWQRALADYRNLQNEIEKRRGEWAQMSEMQVLEGFLPVYENMKKAIGMEHGTWNMEQENWRRGIEHIMAQFNGVLKAHRLEEIKTVGEQLDLKFHEAVGEEKSDQPAGTILKEVETGYKMAERVVKAAKVIVAK